MPRKSAKGKKKICKALNLDGTKCNKVFEVHQHQTSKHKFCSDKCRKRDHRLKKKKERRKEENMLKKMAKSKKHSESILGKLEISYNISMAIFLDIEDVLTPIKQLSKKGISHKDFSGPNGVTLYYDYKEKKEKLKLDEKARKQYLEVNLTNLKTQLNRGINQFSNYLSSEELNLITDKKKKAIISDMTKNILGRCKELSIEAPNGLKPLKTGNINPKGLSKIRESEILDFLKNTNGKSLL